MTHGTPDAIPPPEIGTADDAILIRALQARDERAFARVLDGWYGSMLRIAMGYVGSRARAEEVVQETWMAVLKGVDRFEGRSSLRTWVYRILVNRARTIAVREARLVPISTLGAEVGGSTEDLERLAAVTAEGGDRRTASQWLPSAEGWTERTNPEDWLLSAELRSRIDAAIEALPRRQREVITLRDIDGWSAAEICNALGISETNQRVLLHRARVGVRNALSEYLSETGE